MDNDRPLVSVVAPVYREELGIRAFYDRVSGAMRGIEPAVDWELVFVDDGSPDDSLVELRRLAERDQRVRVLALSRNFGHQLAITAGIEAAIGDAVVVIDSDLQDPPEVIADMVSRWREGWKVVYGQRTRRSGESNFKLVTAKAFYRVLNRMSEVPLPVDTGDFRLMDRLVVDALGELREGNRYVRGLVSWIGFPQCAVLYERDPRFAGETKYTLRKMIRFAVDAVTSFSEKPLRLAAQLGFVTTLFSLALASYFLIAKILDPRSALPGFASLMIVVLFLGGVQLTCMGVLGEYVGRIYRETKRRPLYLVAEELNPPADRRMPGRRPAKS